ncbi:hypothetical protein SAMN04488490_0059 [Marinobacter sp. LV10R510-11A]|uniref:hypothetical protein n=1 Tax=Marinobacter sp. LV10R510-11A TaxID=1415568 RepID=UPI000BB9065B|nr:hypothetical protein [Marinobacter sp. LV10R510-11A]SOB74574.1 hypothetical protein SAMN04488490_0059 [Marinobacter sp. LV10R510-11A]
MVNNRVNVTAYEVKPPGEGEPRKIPGGPLYEHHRVLEILRKGEESTRAWTRKCKSDLQKYALDGDDAVVLLIEALQHGRYQSSEWCEQRSKGPWAACDSYTLTKKEWIRYAHKELQIEYYIKFAIAKTGTVILLVSCHLSEDRG